MVCWYENAVIKAKSLPTLLKPFDIALQWNALMKATAVTGFAPTISPTPTSTRHAMRSSPPTSNAVCRARGATCPRSLRGYD